MKESDYIKQLSEENKKVYQKSLDLMEKGRRKKAVENLDSLLENCPNFIPALNKKAVIYIHKKEINKAQSILRKILKSDSNYAPAITNLGSIAKEMENLERAKELYQKAIKVNDDYGPAYNNLGVIYREEGNYSKSVKYLKKAKKRGSFNYHLNADKPFYKNPGCLLVIFLIIVMTFILYLVLS